jgi:hypothetical protein
MSLFEMDFDAYPNSVAILMPEEMKKNQFLTLRIITYLEFVGSLKNQSFNNSFGTPPAEGNIGKSMKKNSCNGREGNCLKSDKYLKTNPFLLKGEAP